MLEGVKVVKVVDYNGYLRSNIHKLVTFRAQSDVEVCRGQRALSI